MKKLIIMLAFVAIGFSVTSAFSDSSQSDAIGVCYQPFC